MNNLLKITLTTFVLASTSFTALAKNVNLDGVTMEVSRHGKGNMKGHHKTHAFDIYKIVTNYKLENGDITQAELDNNKLERDALFQELKVLKDSGDVDGLKTKKEELKNKFHQKREELKAYVESHPDLKTLIESKKTEMKATMKDRMKKHRGDKKDKKCDNADKKAKSEKQTQ